MTLGARDGIAVEGAQLVCGKSSWVREGIAVEGAGTEMTWWRRGRGVRAGEAGAEVVGNVLHFPRGVQHVGAAETERCMAHVFVLVPLYYCCCYYYYNYHGYYCYYFRLGSCTTVLCHQRSTKFTMGALTGARHDRERGETTINK